MDILDALITALLGYGVVFLGIALLIVVVVIMGKLMYSRKKEAAAPAAPAETVPAPTAPKAPAAPGTAGDLKLYDTPPETAAMIMAIVADKMGLPLNELRFISIKEVK